MIEIQWKFDHLKEFLDSCVFSKVIVGINVLDNLNFINLNVSIS